MKEMSQKRKRAALELYDMDPEESTLENLEAAFNIGSDMDSLLHTIPSFSGFPYASTVDVDTPPQTTSLPETQQLDKSSTESPQDSLELKPDILPRPEGSPFPPTDPLERLLSNDYLLSLKVLETKLRTLRSRLLQHDLLGLDITFPQLRTDLDLFADELDTLKSTHFLRPCDFNHLTSLEDFLSSTLRPQFTLYEQDYAHLTAPDPLPLPSPPLALTILSQENTGPIFKEKPIGPFTLRLLTGSSITEIQSGPVQPELLEISQRIKKNNQDLEGSKVLFRENGTATFSDLKFSSGTFPHLVRLKFKASIQLVWGGERVQRVVESLPTRPFISMTNTGSQWKDAAGACLKEECFRESDEVSVARFWNYFQKHYLIATKQEANNIKRPLFAKDFEYLLQAKFKTEFESFGRKLSINQKEFQIFWDWIGPGLKKVRYQKYMLWLFECGFLICFITGREAEDILRLEPTGTFLIRLSERLDGEFVISYSHASGVRHYLLQPNDTADKKKTLIDFLGQNSLFVYILLKQYYKKPSKPFAKPPLSPGNPYETRLPECGQYH
eukprot:TRINITY_DN5345_c0_g1_i1.p1 TRINITY_DN5345_c0_g1~~TRINITY_DN5345_c0_g1_i1.p1  ORF type:complete len:556 (-),score=167.31 TRINITY_DN5345_c0_g1_i1:77-1744(-)